MLRHISDQYNQGGFVVWLPFKNSICTHQLDLGDSYVPASRMLQRMETRFADDQHLKEAYHSFMSEYEQLRHMVLAPSQLRSKDSFYLPHHGVWKESSSTTKLRTVFNASIKTKHGFSLNNLLHAGPNLLPNLFDLVCAWRRYKYAFVADIEKMFRQVDLHIDDQLYQSILWRSDPSETVKIFRLTTVTYGMKSSSFLASRSIKQLACDSETEHPLGAKVLKSE